MSTKYSLAYADNFHFYHDLMDEEESFYLRISKTDFEACPGSVTIKIPPEVWGTIRQIPVDLSYADKTDEELRLLVEKEVDERIENYNQATEDRKALVEFCGSRVYGCYMDRQTQIDSGFKYFKNLRKKHLTILAMMQSHIISTDKI